MPFPDNKHHHAKCLTNARKRLDVRAEAVSKRLGVNDKRIYEILLSEHRAFSAYEIVAHPGQNGKRLQANQVYRSAQTLIELGVAHRVELKNGYMACHSHGNCTAQQILICKSCNAVAEAEHVTFDKAISDMTATTGFIADQQKLELVGICPNCTTINEEKTP